ncbi:MAG: hypothetical protein KKF80_07260, partial [Candidatus Omnitrophica bacterium]|nr:hypothetical protein [Candidatus Omnitrophota bacterium]
IGNIDTQRWEDIWNSDSAIEIRRSIIDGDYTYCSRLLCPKIQNGQLLKKKDVKDPFFLNAIDKREFVLSAGPREYVLGHDLSCNFSCPSCRKEKFNLSKDEEKRFSLIKDNVVMPILKHAKLFMLSGSGEFCVSRHCLEILKLLTLKEYPGLKISILTNGILFTEALWQEFANIHDMLEEINVSVDAVNAHTYHDLRIGGNFKRLMGNLQFFSVLKKTGKIKKFVINMIVQKANFLEMKKFVEMGNVLGCDQITFSRITNWGCFSPDKFREIDIVSPLHLEHGKFLDILRDPVFKNKNVDLYNIYRFWEEENFMDTMAGKE